MSKKKIICIFGILGGLIAGFNKFIDFVGDYADTAPIDNDFGFIYNSHLYISLMIMIVLGFIIGGFLGWIIFSFYKTRRINKDI